MGCNYIAAYSLLFVVYPLESLTLTYRIVKVQWTQFI